MNRLIILLFALSALILSVTAGTPPSFCKCTCFTNSTIIALSSHTASPSEKSTDLQHRANAATCTLCNRAFCLAQRLPICKDAVETDVFTTCFQRDSRKDQIVVLTFIAGTVGLLVWAAVRKFLERKREGLGGGGDAQQGYIPVTNR